MHHSNVTGAAGFDAVPDRGLVPPRRAYPAAAAPPAAALSRRVRRVAARVVFGGALALLAIAAVLIGMRTVYAERIYPAVYVDTIAVGGQDIAAARALVQARVDQLETGSVRFHYGETVWTPRLSEIGVTFDVERSLDAAYAIGRETSARDRLLAVGGLVRHDQRVSLVVRFDQATLYAWLDGVDAELGLPPHDASLKIEGTEITIVPEVDGTIVDRDQTTRLVLTAVQTLRPIAAPLPATNRIAKVRAADLESAKASIERMLSRPVELTFNDESWVLEPSAISAFISASIDPEKRGSAAVAVGVDQTGLSKWLNKQFAVAINRDPVDAEVAWDEEKNRITGTKKSRDGRKLKPMTLASQVIASLSSNHGAVEIPITVIAPRVDSGNLKALGITTELATGDSSYQGSNEERSTNIQVGSSLLNGTLVAPGEEFSFNHAIGVIEKSKGYVDAAVIEGERIGRDVGGGICQVSTTVFRAALRAGVPVTEWWPHTYRLGFYELDNWAPGFDASILQPEGDPFSGGDFQFRNDTGSWILVESYTRDDRVFVVLYGADLGRQVTLTEPKLSDPIPPPDDDLEIVDEELPAGTIQQTEKAQEGLEVVFKRTVADRDGQTLFEDTWETRYESRPDVWQVSPDMEGKSPASLND